MKLAEVSALALTVLLTTGCSPPPASEVAGTTHRLPAAEPRSGYHYQSADTQALQDDAFANPGMLWIDQGISLWLQSPSEGSRSCASCHDQDSPEPAAGMRGVALRYPALDANTKKLSNLAGRINRCRTEQQQQAPYAWESDALLALTALVAYQSKGMTIERAISAELEPFFQAGKDYFYTRRGQMNLACYQCHEDNAGNMLRGDRLSEGHGNGYPAYRLQWQTIGSLQRRLRFCDVGVRAEPFAYGAAEYLNLELFLQWRANGLPVETPAVRR